LSGLPRLAIIFERPAPFCRLAFFDGNHFLMLVFVVDDADGVLARFNCKHNGLRATPLAFSVDVDDC